MNTERDEMLTALDHLEETLRSCTGRQQALLARIDVIRDHRGHGKGYRDSAMTVERPLIAEMLTHLINELIDAGSRVRKAQAAALHAEGMTMDQIAELFGVSRQRVSALLRDARSGRHT